MTSHTFRETLNLTRLAAVSILLAFTAFGQDRSGMIIGTVTDSGGASVVDANVIVLNQETNASVGIKTNGTGDYKTPSLQPGSYTVVVKKDGFQPFRRNDIGVGADQTVRVNAVLATGKPAQPSQ